MDIEEENFTRINHFNGGTTLRENGAMDVFKQRAINGADIGLGLDTLSSEEIIDVSELVESSGLKQDDDLYLDDIRSLFPPETSLCSVCGDTAAGFHCGAYVCEACKKFFVRCLKHDSGLKFACANDRQCEVTKETRTQCPSCRFQKCLSLGMYSPGGPNVSDDIGHIPCKVCGAPSSGFHFGAITCEGCKGFFRRTVKERGGSVKYSCTRDGQCSVTWKTRNACKFCRYQRCLSAGMMPEKSRIGRQPNSIKHATMIQLYKIKAAKGLIQSYDSHPFSAGPQAPSDFSDFDLQPKIEPLSDDDDDDIGNDDDCFAVQSVMMGTGKKIIDEDLAVIERLYSGMTAEPSRNDLINNRKHKNQDPLDEMGTLEESYRKKRGSFIDSQHYNNSSLSHSQSYDALQNAHFLSAEQRNAEIRRSQLLKIPTVGYRDNFREFDSGVDHFNYNNNNNHYQGAEYFSDDFQIPQHKHSLNHYDQNRSQNQMKYGSNYQSDDVFRDNDKHSNAVACDLAKAVQKFNFTNPDSSVENHLPKIHSIDGLAYQNSGLRQDDQNSLMLHHDNILPINRSDRAFNNCIKYISDTGLSHSAQIQSSDRKFVKQPSIPSHGESCELPSSTSVTPPSETRINYHEVIEIMRLAFNDLKEMLNLPCVPINRGMALLEIWDSMMRSFTDKSILCLKFSKKVPVLESRNWRKALKTFSFKLLPIETQVEVVQNCMFPIVLVVLSRTYNVETKEYNWFGYPSEMGNLICEEFYPFQKLLPWLHKMGQVMYELKFDDIEQSFLCGLSLVDSANNAEYKELLLDALNEYCCSKYRGKHLEKAFNGMQTGNIEDAGMTEARYRCGHVLMCIRLMAEADISHQQAIEQLLTDKKFEKVEFPQLFKETYIDGSMDR